MQSDTTAAFHLSPQQRLLWESAPTKRSKLIVQVEGQLDVARLRTAIEKLAARHEILRTTYPRTMGVKTPFQVVGSASCADLTIGANGFALEIPAMSADVESLTNIFREIADLYAGADPEDALQYVDYSEWHSELRQKDDAEAGAAKTFWTARAWDSIPQPSLPFERKAASAERTAISFSHGCLDPEAVAAAWTTLLWRLTGQAEIVIGRVVKGRSQEEFKAGVGLYAKVLPEYASFAGGEITFGELTAQMKSNRETAARWEDYGPEIPFGSLKFGVSSTDRPGPITRDGVTFSLAGTEAYSAFAIELRCLPEGRAELIFDPALYPADLIERIASMLTVLTAADPRLSVGDISILDSDERNRILNAFNKTAVEFPGNQCFHQLFEAQVAEIPDLPALQDENVSFSYAKLNESANRLAHVLQARGVRANVPVGLLMERSATMIVAVLGILKAGGCYVPLLPDHPKARLLHQLSETGAPVLVCDEKFSGLLPEFTGAVIRYGDYSASPAGNPAVVSSPEDLMYIMYTSGSTGTPKGVAVRHRNVVNYSSFVQKLTGGRGLHFATVSTLAADLGNTCIFPALISGGCVHVIGYETALSGEMFARYAANHPLDVLKITPSHLTMLLDSAGVSVLPRRFLISGGEALSWSLHQRIREGGCAVINHYGPTEATIGCCTFDGARNVSDWQPATVPIGRPIGNTQVYILDRSQPVPIGVAGELCVGGDGVAQGYYGQPGQTEERFVQNPFVSPATVIYRTGDLARFLPTGDVEFLGRIDQQIKIRGFRVEPAEIEAAVRRHPGVRQAVVIAEDSGGERMLAAYVAADKALELAEWRLFLRDHLPDYMIPARFVTVGELPLTPNGKVDFRALAALGKEHDNKATRRLEGPRNATEEKMTMIWREILKTDRVGINDNFFELGGHSLLATQIIARIRNGFGVQFPLHSFLESPTIAMVCTRLEMFPKIENEEDTIARLMREMDGLSEEEAEMLLKTMDGAGAS